jgi:glucose-1-phosphate cytidylyltransferase
MQAVILAGGLGSRLTEETRNRPKPMVEIGGMPILWHIMQIYAHHGVKEFIICLGYRGEMIKEFFINLPRYSNNLTVHSDGVVEYLSPPDNDWKVSLVETGALTQTGGRLKKIADFLTGDVFCMTYGDGVASVNIRKLINFHSKHEL